MDESTESGLKKILIKFRYTWIVVFTGMAAIIVLTTVLYYFQIIDLTPVVDISNAEKITLAIILIIILAVFFIKRSYLIVSKIIEKSKKYRDKINKDDFLFLSGQNEKDNIFAASIMYVNRLYLLVWFLADLVVLTAFVNFILVPVIKNFYIYSFVGLYSLIINFPSFKLYKKLYKFIIS